MIRIRVTTVAAAGLAAAVVVAASGCGNSDDLGSSPPVRASDAASQSTGEGRPDGSDSSDGSGSGGVSAGPDGTASPGRGGDSQGASAVPEVSRTTRIEAAEGVPGSLEIGLAGLDVDGKLVTLVLVYTPRYDSDPGGTISLFDMFARNVAEVTLVDSVNLRRYLVVEDSRGLELGPFPATVETRNNLPVSASYTFAAPPADVATVDVYIDDRRIFDDVEVAR